jgi:hypothetical protein
MPTSRERRVARARRTHTSLDAEWMVHLARTLADPDAEGGSSPAALVVVERPPDGPATDQSHGEVTTTPLPADDPVLGLFGRIAGPETTAVGMVGPARARSMEDAEIGGHGQFVHLLRRDGMAVTVVPPSGEAPSRTLGPTDEPQVGRVPDACRRILGLPTAPPPTSTVGLWVDTWLDLVFLRALRPPTVRWPELAHELTSCLQSFPGAPTDQARTATPAQIARLLVAIGHSVTWEELREVDIARAVDRTRSGGDAITDADAEAPGYGARVLQWMDVGMYARIRFADHLPRAVVLDTLEQQLPATVLDQVYATLALTMTHLPGRDVA